LAKQLGADEADDGETDNADDTEADERGSTWTRWLPWRRA
jgi:hypothetical protein